jgi:hypothetical protein
MLANDNFLDQLITNQQRVIRYYLVFAPGLILLGVVVSLIAFVSPAWFDPDSKIIPDAFKGLFGIGGAFVSSLSAFQIKEMLDHKEKIQTFRPIQANPKNEKAASSEERKRIDNLYRALWGKV